MVLILTNKSSAIIKRMGFLHEFLTPPCSSGKFVQVSGLVFALAEL